MRANVAGAMILGGTLLGFALALVDTVDNLAASLWRMPRTELTSFSLASARMAFGYRVTCWAVGGALLFIGTMKGMFSRSQVAPLRE
ncbi:MAG TPA: hypothetical protein VHU84_14360 [Lacipirellulaceae bacterium]|jgi:hypothetical protein|nr:hypothetical protein [Lacipirellulaceae bacterium]